MSGKEKRGYEPPKVPVRPPNQSVGNGYTPPPSPKKPPSNPPSPK